MQSWEIISSPLEPFLIFHIIFYHTFIKDLSMNIYVGNLAKEVSDQDLENLFSAYGSVKSSKVIRDLFSGESKGFGFVEMNGMQESQTAISELNAKEVMGKKIVVNEARPKTEGGRGGSRGGSGGGRGGFGGNKSGGFNSNRNSGGGRSRY
jgi:RNA recognition motif-containing protein